CRPCECCTPPLYPSTRQRCNAALAAKAEQAHRKAGGASLAISVIELGGGRGKMNNEAMNARKRNQQPVQFQTARQCGARTKSGMPCQSPATKKRRCRLHGGSSGGPPGERNGQFRHGERTKGAIAERQKFSASLKMLRAGPT